MLKDLIFLGVGAIFGLGTALMAAAAPLYYPNAPSWVWHWLFWGGLSVMALMALDAALLFLWRSDAGPKLWPALVLNLGLATAAAATIWHYSSSREPHQAKATIESLPIGSFYYHTFIGHVRHFILSNRTSIQMMIELQNNNSFMLKFRASLFGQANGKTVSPEAQQRLNNIVGYAPGNSKALLKYDVILDVPVDPNRDINTPFIAGTLDYRVEYFAAPNGATVRKTGRTVAFEMFPGPQGIPGTRTYETKTTFFNEAEE